MPGTPSPNADSPHGQSEAGHRIRRLRGRIGSLPRVPRTFRARLAVLISAVVAFALLLVLLVLPRLLDGYLRQQEQQGLDARAHAVGQLLYQDLLIIQRGGAVPILTPTVPPHLSTQLVDALTAQGETPQEQSYLAAIAQAVAQADLTIAFYETTATGGTPLSELSAAAAPQHAGQARESISSSFRFSVPDLFWSQFASSVPQRGVVVTLGQPYTLREETLGTVFTVLIIVAVSALSLAVVVAFIVADRLTTPLRRLIRASRALSEGNLTARVQATPSGSPEITELATTFNLMAERLEESIEFIRHDRDRSRDFLADVSHELRTPIAALRTFNDLLRDGAAANGAGRRLDPATTREFLETSGQQIDRLEWLAANLLELSKLDSGLVALELRPEDLRAAIESAVQQAELSAKKKGVELGVDMPSEPVRQLHDPQRLGQVMSNLVGNAVKFTPSGGRVDVSLHATPTGARLVVADTGIGIDAEELPHVFERFYRGSRSNEVRASGSGLGLSIARSIVEMHGGRISIASTVGKGTRVEVWLPREPKHPATPDASETDVTESSPSAARA